MRQQQCFMEVEGETTSNPVCKGQFSKNVTRNDCCCTGVGAAYGSECRLCPKSKTSKIQHQNFPYYLRTFSVIQFRRIKLFVKLIAHICIFSVLFLPT